MDIDTVVLSEIKERGSGEEIIGGYTHVCSSLKNERSAIGISM